MRIVVKEALNDEEAVRVGKTIAHSPLVKTAFLPAILTGGVFWRQLVAPAWKIWCWIRYRFIWMMSA